MHNRVVLALHKGNITMRKWIGLILTVLLIIVFLPAGFGLLAKKSLDRLVTDLPMPDGVTLTVQDYTFGWLSSYVALKVHVLKNEKRARYITDDAVDIIVHGHVAHGPFVMTQRGLRTGIARVDTHATLKDFHGLSEQTQKELALLFKDNELLHASSVFQFIQGIHIDLKSSPIQAQVAGDSVQWNGFDAQIQVNHSFDSVHTHAIFSPILFTTQQGAILDAAQSEFVAELHRENASLWTGEQTFSLPTFYLKDEAGAVLRFDHLRLTSVSNILDHLLQASLMIEADNIELNNQIVEQLRFDMELANIASDPLLALSQLMKKPQPWLSADKREGFKLIMQALSPGADLEINYTLNMKNDRIVLQGMLDFPNISDKVDQNAAVTAQQLLQGLNAQLEFMAPQSVVNELLFDMTWASLTRQMGAQGVDEEMRIKQMIDKQVQTLVQNGVLVAKDNSYLLNFDYQQGNMVLNTRAISEGEMFLLLMLLLQATPDESIAH